MNELNELTTLKGFCRLFVWTHEGTIPGNKICRPLLELFTHVQCEVDIYMKVSPCFQNHRESNTVTNCPHEESIRHLFDGPWLHYWDKSTVFCIYTWWSISVLLLWFRKGYMRLEHSACVILLQPWKIRDCFGEICLCKQNRKAIKCNRPSINIKIKYIASRTICGISGKSIRLQLPRLKRLHMCQWGK